MKRSTWIKLGLTAAVVAAATGIIVSQILDMLWLLGILEGRIVGTSSINPDYVFSTIIFT